MGEQKGKIKRRTGIVRGPYRSKVDGSTQALMPRTCLACGKMFKSDLPVRINRICPKCRYLESRDNGMFGPGTPIVDHGGWTSRDTDD
jgi:hypothetical protein